MNRWLALVLAVVLGLALGFLASRDDDAEQERAARQRAEQQALQADSAARAARRERDAVVDSLARLDSIYADSLARAQAAVTVARTEATNRTDRLRETLTAQQQHELDQITAYWSEALDEAGRALRAANARHELALAKAATDSALAVDAERERGDRWKAAYDAATAEIKALREPDVSIFGLGLNVGCAAGLSASAGYGQAAGVGVTCGVEL